jgi:hypothetical protein
VSSIRWKTRGGPVREAAEHDMKLTEDVGDDGALAQTAA